MPKVLSLKKSSTNNSKQKPITQFFKCDDTKANKGSQLQVGTSANHENNEVKKNTKRKALSPVQCTSNFFIDKLNEDVKIKDSPSKDSSSKRQKCESKLSESDFSKSEVNTKVTKNAVNKNTSNTPGISGSLEKRKPLSPLNQDDVSIDKTDYTLNDKLSVKENGHYVNCSPALKKGSPLKNNFLSLAVRKSPTKVPRATPSPKTSPRKPLYKTPDKHRKPSLELSPSKHGSTVKVLTFSQNTVEDIFDDDWDFQNGEDLMEDLDLSIMQRCEILSVTNQLSRLELRLKNDSNNRGTCLIEGVWMNTPLQEGDIISILATRNSSGQFAITNSSGLLALRPDYLISSTSVVAGVFCKRKAVLQERWRGIDSANTAMTIGILVHELVQLALTRHIKSVASLRAEVDTIIKQSPQMLYDAGLSVEETRANMESYITPLAEFMQGYFKSNKGTVVKQKGQWNGTIDEVLDIEENVCCPTLGLKGKIDATLQVTIHERTGTEREIVPLELKSGKASVSAEHRGQLVLYCMMLGVQRARDPAAAAQRGLLLYLKDKIECREVSCGYPERRDLMMLRNDLVQHLAEGPTPLDTEQLVDIEEASRLLQQSLPEPVRHERACANCPYLTICSLHLWNTNGPTVSETHPLTKLRDTAVGHLSPAHVKYFLHWTCLLRLEEKEQTTSAPLRALWTDSAEKRAKRGTCASNLKLKTVSPSGDRYEHVFEKESNLQKGFKNNPNGPQQGDFSIVSIENRPWIAAGMVTVSNEKEISIMLERDLSRRLDKSTMYHIDTYESYATTVYNLTNLGVLMEDSDRALRLRTLVVDRAEPQFAEKLPRSVGRLGARLMRPLNVQQQRAVLRALAAHDYALLQGLPGTGKTQTISILIQMLVGLQQRVLVTAHTHSAVDTVLARLPESVRVLRLGPAARVAAGLRTRTESALAAHCTAPEQLAQLYDSMDVVGVTCLGASHALFSRTTFDVCIVDEATQVLQSTVLRPLLAAKRFVLVGDPDQLPPVVRSKAARRLGMEESLFHRLMCEQAVCALRLQYRMNEPLAAAANRVAYGGRLQCASQDVARATLNFDVQKVSVTTTTSALMTACSPDVALAAVFLDMPAPVSDCPDPKNITNVDEACVVLALVDTLKQGGVTSNDIGVIAPYRDQVSLLRRALEHTAVEVSTVDQFQGRDKSVIIYSCTRRDDGNNDKKVKDGEVLNDQRRLAVSVTRAKHKLIVVGNGRALARYHTLQPLLDACHRIPLPQDVIQHLLEQFKKFVT